MSTIINPTVGRVVWFFPSPRSADHRPGAMLDQQQPFAATVVYVHDAGTVNLVYHDHMGCRFCAHHVALRGPGEEWPSGLDAWEWMPYQLGQAAKADDALDRLRAVAAKNAEVALDATKRPEVQTLPSRFQIGENVLLPCQVVAVAFDNGKVRYRVSLTESGDEVSVPSECVAPDKVERVQ